MSRSASALRLPARMLAVVTVLALTSACSGSETPATPRPSSSTTSATQAPGIAAGVSESELTTHLAAVGIETYASAGDTRPVVAATEPGPMRLTGWQLQNMHRQLVSGRGYLGSDLDELTAGESAPVPISVVLAAWIVAAHTPASDYAAELMGERDYPHDAVDIAYPDAVVAMFVNDLAADSSAAGSSAGSADPAASTAPTTASPVQPAAYVPTRVGLCTTLVNGLSSSLSSIVTSLQARVDAGSSILVHIWNTVVEIAASALKAAVKAFTTTFLAPITRAITLLAVLSSAATLLDPWTVTATAKPGLSIGPGTDATVTASVASTIGFMWPADVTSCAQELADVQLPDPGSPAGSEVAWTFVNPYGNATQGAADEKVRDDDTAMLQFSTAADDAEGSPVAHLVGVKVDVKRTAVPKLIDLIRGLIINGLPPLVKELVDALLGPPVAAVSKKLSELATVQGPTTTFDAFTFEPSPVPPVETPPVTTQPTCDLEGQKQLPDGTYSGPIALDVDTSGVHRKHSGNVKTTTRNGSKMRFRVKDGKATGSWNVNWYSAGEVRQKGYSTMITVHGKISGNVTGSVDKGLELYGIWQIQGSASVPDVDQVIPVDFRGDDSEYLLLKSIDCDRVVMTFIPSFNGGGEGLAFTGTAEWEGERISR